MSRKRSRSTRPAELADTSGKKGATKGRSLKRETPPGYKQPKVRVRRVLAPLEGLPRFPKAFWILLAIAAALRFFWMNQEGFWPDEVYVYNDCLRSFAHKLHTVHIAHFLIGQAFLSVWDSVAALRLMTLLWGLLTFPFLYDLAARLLRRRAAILATAFLAFSAYHVDYSLDANYYAPMIFFSTVGMWFAVRYIQNAHPIDLFLSLGALAAGFLFHPFSGVLAAATAAILFLLVLSYRRYRVLMWPPTWWDARQEGWALLVAVVEAGIVAGIVFVFIPRARGSFDLILEWLKLGATPRNYRLFPNLIYDYFRGNYTDYPLSSRLAMSFAWPAVVVAGVGVVTSIRRRPWIAALFFGPIVGSFVLITNLKAHHHFYIRYFTYLFPALVMYLLWGAEQLAAWGRANGNGGRADDPESGMLLQQGRRSGPWVVIGVYVAGVALAVVTKWTVPDAADWIAWAIALVLLLSFTPLSRSFSFLTRSRLAVGAVGFFILVNAVDVGYRFLIRGGRNWNAAVAYLKKDARKGQLLLYEYPQEGEMLRYYLPRIGLSFRDTLKLPEGDQAPFVRLAQVKGMARIDPDFWLIRSWNINQKPVLNAWADRHLDRVVDAPSNFEPFLDVFLYKGDVQGRYLLAPYGLRIQYRTNEATIAADLSANGAKGWERVVDVEDPTTVALRLRNPTILAAGARIRATVDGKPGPWFTPNIPGPAVSIPEGKHRLGIGVESKQPLETPPDTLWSSLDLPQGITFPATRVSLPFPSFCQFDTYRGKSALRLIRNLGVQYWFNFPEAGTYEFRIEAVHDKPRPVWLDVAVDESFQGIVNFDRLNNEWGVKSMPIRVPNAGWHSVAVNLVSAGPAKWGLKPDEETNAILGNFTLRRLTPGETARDDRIAPDGHKIPSTIPIPVTDNTGTRALPGWEIRGDLGTERVVSKRPVELREERAVEIEVPPNSKGVNLFAPPRPCLPGERLIHAEATLGVFDLINHSVSLGIVFLNKENQPMQGSNPIGQESIYRSMDGYRFTVVSPVPKGAVRYALLVTTYQNGQRPANRPGWIRVGNVAVGEQ